MNNITCRVCGEYKSFRKLWDLPDRHYISSERFPLVQCSKCGVAFLNPMPGSEELARHYPSVYYGRPPQYPSLPYSFHWRRSQIIKKKATGEILDVGCGNGGFLTYMKERGWDVYGIDNSPHAVQIAGITLEGKVRHVCDLSEASFPSGHFDVITLFEVFEHLPEPLSTLREIRRILKVDGLLFFSVPNFASLEKMVFGPWWNGLDAPRHLFQYGPKTIKRLMEAAGFQTVTVKSVSAHNIQVRKSLIDYCQESLRFFLRDKGLYPQQTQKLEEPVSPPVHEHAKKALWKQGVFFVECVVFGPFWLLSRITDKDNTLWVSAQKHYSESSSQ